MKAWVAGSWLFQGRETANGLQDNVGAAGRWCVSELGHCRGGLGNNVQQCHGIQRTRHNISQAGALCLYKLQVPCSS